MGTMLLSAPAWGAEARGRPNVVLIITDDQGYGDLGFHGNPDVRTPNLDRLAGESTEVVRFYVTPVCAPTRAGLLTGRYHLRTGAIDTFLGRALMRADEETLAEVLSKAGYATGIFGKWHLGDNHPMRPGDQGFAESLVHRGGGIGQPSDPPGNPYTNPKLLHNGKEVGSMGYCTDVFFDAAGAFVEKNRERPFFCYVATNAPHEPLQVPEEWVRPYRERGIAEQRAKIYAMCENIDRNVGKLMAKLDALGVANDTIVIYMHDNGPQQKRYNAGLRGLKGSCYEGGIRSPLLVRWPGRVEKGRKVQAPLSYVDIVPTLLEWCGVARPQAKLDGVSVAGVLGGAGEIPERYVFSQWHRGDEPIRHRQSAVIGRRWKLVDGVELYDLQADPGEAKDVAADHPAVVREMRAAYDRWFADVTAGGAYRPGVIVVGTAHEDPVVLTRQDWRGPAAGWNPKQNGHWDVRVAAAGRYRFVLRFPAAQGSGDVKLALGESLLSQPVENGSTSAAFEATLAAGDSKVQGFLELTGGIWPPHYVEVSRIGGE